MEQEKIGKFISELRKEKNMTQEDLGELLGVTSKSISRWENGITMPDISMLTFLAKYLNCDIQELLNGRRRTKEELIDLKDTIDKLIEYENIKEIKNNQKFNKYNLIGSITLLLALLNNVFPYLNYIFTPNIAHFVQGGLFGISICANFISVYNRSHQKSFCEKKKEVLNKLNKKTKLKN